MLPFSESCERNKDFILDHLRAWFSRPMTVLEIGSGTGQHAEYFAGALPGIEWITSDIGAYLVGLAARVEQAGLPNLGPPRELDVAQPDWPKADAIFSANSLHIMSWGHVEAFFNGCGQALGPGGLLVVYGPFKYGGEFTTPSNANFDIWLKQRDPVSGVRDFEAVDGLAREQGLELVADNAMPANNQLLVWEYG